MRSHPSTPLFIVAVTLASMLGVSPITGDEFTSGTHTVNSAIDGIFATGPNTVITIEESAIVQPIPDFPGFPTLRSLVAEDGARIIVNGGTFTNRIESQTNATIDINGGVFRNSVQPGSLMNIRGGIFNGQVLAGGDGQLNIYGGSFSSEISVGYDSSDGAEVNIFAKSFAFGEDLEALLAEDFPFDVPGLERGQHLAEGMVHRCARGRGGRDDAGVANHVGVGEVEDERPVVAGADSPSGRLRHGGCAHLRLQVVGRHLGRRDKTAALAGELVFLSSIEEVGHVRVLLRLLNIT